MLLIPIGEPWPLDHFVERIEEIPAITPEDIRGIDAEVTDVTSIHDKNSWRTKVVTGLTIRLRTGSRYSISEGWLALGLRGGGTFYKVRPYGEFSTMTKQEYEAEEQQEDEQQEYDWQD